MSEDIKSIINGLIATHAGVPAETLNDPDIRLDAMTMDSLSMVELMFDIEEKYNVHIDDPLQLKDITLGQLHEMVAEIIERGAVKSMSATQPAESADAAQA